MINYDLTKISTIVFDVDGVLSCNTIPMNSGGYPVRTVNIKDGYAMQLAIKMGLRLCIITGGRDESIRRRYNNLGMEDVFISAGVKIDVLRKYMLQHSLSKEEVMYVGDDIPDYEAMREVGLAVAPCDACTDIRQIAHYVSPVKGGMGVARDVIEQVMRAKGLWLSSEKAFGW